MAGAATLGGTFLGSGVNALAADDKALKPPVSQKAIWHCFALRLPAEILESDSWTQYNELGGIPDSEVPREAVIRCTLQSFRYWIKTSRITFTTTLTMRLLTSRSSMPIWLRRVPTQWTWSLFALCKVLQRRVEREATTDKPDATDSGHQLVDSLSQ